jgi:hypothetical protein
MASNIALDPESGRPYIQEGANDATLVEDPDGRGAYLVRNPGWQHYSALDLAGLIAGMPA